MNAVSAAIYNDKRSILGLRKIDRVNEIGKVNCCDSVLWLWPRSVQANDLGNAVENGCDALSFIALAGQNNRSWVTSQCEVNRGVLARTVDEPCCIAGLIKIDQLIIVSAKLTRPGSGKRGRSA
jgi:hypothetical protein